MAEASLLLASESEGHDLYWEQRARRFAARGRGLKAVCSYGMPDFHNWAIDRCQRRALGSWLQPRPGLEVLDLGCGIGRWSRRLALGGARVTGVDVSPTMIAEAARRARAAGLRRLALGRRFELVLGVTVLQHLVADEELNAALEAIRAHLAEGGRAVLLEAAPSAPNARCDTRVFRARTESVWRAACARAGLGVVSVGGVDPVPLRTWLLPHYRRLPPGLRLAALGLATALSVPVDLALGRRLVARSWHKVLVLEPLGRIGP